MHGIAKIYAGELVEDAKIFMVEEEELTNLNQGKKEKPMSYGAIKTRHLREARRRMIERGKLLIN